jgi:hypothetical protein
MLRKPKHPRSELEFRRLLMKNAALGIVCVLAWISLSVGADFSSVNEGNAHGDPPFLLKDGWKPLLNGKNLDGWRYMDALSHCAG